MDLNLRGKVALVVASSEGLGMEVARQLSLEGCKVMINSRDADLLKKAKIELREVALGPIECYPCDITRATDINALVTKTRELFVTMAGKNISSVEIRRAGNDEFYFVFRLPSDGMFVSIFFDSLSEVVAIVEYSQRNSKDETRYLCKNKPSGEDYFVFLTKNDKPIGQSTMFRKKTTMQVGLQYMQMHFQVAEVADLTE